jgi:hypothetical protein
MRGWHHEGGGEVTENDLMSLSLSAMDKSKLPRAMPTPINRWTQLVLSSLFHLQSSVGGLEKQPLLVVLGSYVHCYVSVLHLILIDFCT